MTLPALASGLALLLQAAPAEAAPTVDAPAIAPVIVEARPITSTPLKRSHAKGDPFEKYNRYFFRRQQTFDRKFLRPVALGYKHVVPYFVRVALRNIFRNLGEPLVFMNYVLQLKPGKAAETAGRFVLNSSIGIGGAVDVAATPPIRLPHRPNGLGDTLGYYGVKPGPYLFLPLLGPTTLRDLIGGQAEAVILPLAVGTPFDRAEYQVPRAVVTGLDARAEADQDLKAILSDAVDPYATFRSVFLQDRAGEIAALHGPGKAATPTDKALGDPLTDPAVTPSTGATSHELQDPLVDPAVGPPAPQDAPTATAPAPALAQSNARELQDPLADPAATPSPSTPAKAGLQSERP